MKKEILIEFIHIKEQLVWIEKDLKLYLTNYNQRKQIIEDSLVKLEDKIKRISND